MDTGKYYDFSSHFDNNVSAVLSKRNLVPFQLSHKEKVYFFLNEILIDKNKIVIPSQTHSKNCRVINENGIYKNVDGLITQNPNLILIPMKY